MLSARFTTCHFTGWQRRRACVLICCQIVRDFLNEILVIAALVGWLVGRRIDYLRDPGSLLVAPLNFQGFGGPYPFRPLSDCLPVFGQACRAIHRT